MSTAHLGQRGRNRTINLDQRGKDRLAWSSVAVRHIFDIEASASVLVRYALHLLTKDLEKHLKSNEAAVARACAALKAASKGKEIPLPAVQLTATPPLPFTHIEREAVAATRQAFSEWMLSELTMEPRHHDQ